MNSISLPVAKPSLCTCAGLWKSNSACPGASLLGEFPCLAMSTCWPSREPRSKPNGRSWVAAHSTGRIWQRHGSPQQRNATATLSSPASASTTTEQQKRKKEKKGHSEEAAFNVNVLQHCLLTRMSSGFPNTSCSQTLFITIVSYHVLVWLYVGNLNYSHHLTHHVTSTITFFRYI